MKKIKITLTYILFLIIITTVLSSDNTIPTIFKKAIDAYDSGKYEEALKLFKQIESYNIIDPNLFYNIGNCYFQLKKIGYAILYYLKAKELAPRDEDIKANLQLASSLTTDKIEIPKPSFVHKILTILYNNFNLDELTIISLLFYLIFFISLFISIFNKGKRYVLITIIISIISFLMFTWSGVSLLSKKHYYRKYPRIVILEKEVEVKSGPSENYTTIFTVHEGTQGVFKKKRKGWCQISLDNGWNGWVPEKSIGVIQILNRAQKRT